MRNEERRTMISRTARTSTHVNIVSAIATREGFAALASGVPQVSDSRCSRSPPFGVPETARVRSPNVTAALKSQIAESMVALKNKGKQAAMSCAANRKLANKAKYFDFYKNFANDDKVSLLRTVHFSTFNPEGIRMKAIAAARDGSKGPSK